MPNVPQCTHVKTNGEVCGSPAVSGTAFCYHHSAVKTALAKAQPNGNVPDQGFAPIPFVFPEDRASMQINFFLLLQAFNEQRIDRRTYNCFLNLLKAMAKNLGKTGSLVEPAAEVTDQPSAASRHNGPAEPASGSIGEHDKKGAGRSAQQALATRIPAIPQRIADPLTEQANDALQEFFRSERAANSRVACLA